MVAEPIPAKSDIDSAEREPTSRQDSAPFVYLAILSSIAVGLALGSFVLLGEPSPPQTVTVQRLNYIVILAGFQNGAGFGLAAMAGFWCAMGPGAFTIRSPLSLLWVGLIIGACELNLFLHGTMRQSETVIVAIALVAAWLAIQVPLWILRGLTGTHVALIGSVSQEKESQFRIGQVLVLTTIVAIVLGIARSAISVQNDEFQAAWAIIIGMAIAIVSAMILIIPLALAALAPRYAAWAVVAVIALGALVTYFEIAIFNQLGARRAVVSLSIISWAHFFAAVWTLVFTLLARVNGFRLVRS